MPVGHSLARNQDFAKDGGLEIKIFQKGLKWEKR